MNFQNRQQMLGILAGAALALLVGDRMVLTPLAKSWKERSARIGELRESVTQGAAKLEQERVRESGGRKSIRSRHANMLSNTLSAKISIAESQMLNAFDSWSRKSNVSVTQIRPQWKRGSADDYATLECRADVSGSLSSLTQFLYLVEQDPLAIKLDSVELTTRDNNGQQLTLGLQVSGLQLAAPGS